MQVELDMGEGNIYNILLLSFNLYTVIADVQHDLGMMHLELEEFEEAQKHLLSSSEILMKLYYEEQPKYARQLLEIKKKLLKAEEIREAADDSMLGTNLQSLK